MNAQRYPEEFRIEAVKQILEHGHSVADVSRRLGVSTNSLYKWIQVQQIPATKRQEQISQSEELRRIKAELKMESGGVYGYGKLTLDMRDLGETCSRHRVARLLRDEGLKAQRGYGRRPRVRGGSPAVVAPNLLAQQFTVSAPNTAWVTDITYIATHEGWLYLAAVIDLFSRQVVGWATGSHIDTQLALDALQWQFGTGGHALK